MHPSAPSNEPCQRCGDFAPLQQVGDQRVCANCIDRALPIIGTPLEIGQVFKDLFWLIRRAGPIAIGVQLVLQLINVGIQVAVGMPRPPTGVPDMRALMDYYAALAAWMVPVMLFGFLVSPAGMALSYGAIGDAIANGSVALDRVLPKLRRYPAMVAFVFLNGLGLGFGFLLCCIPGFVLMLRWAGATSAVVIEDAGPVAGLSLAWKRTGSKWAEILVVFILFWVIAFIPMMIPSALNFVIDVEAAMAGQVHPLVQLMTGLVYGIIFPLYFMLDAIIWAKTGGRPAPTQR